MVLVRITEEGLRVSDNKWDVLLLSRDAAGKGREHNILNLNKSKC